jgi:tungstate transport system substrate-binding protein
MNDCRTLLPTDRGTYYAFALDRPAETDLVVLHENHQKLRNPYSIIAVDPRRHPGANYTAARSYIEWISSPEVQRMIGRYQVQGNVLFHPAASRN